MEPAIEIKHLSKAYMLKKAGPYVALRDVISQSVSSLFRQKEKTQTFFALNDINLIVNRGDRLGIVGHNGAGKSTLLKIISRVTPPSNGKVTLNGRVASLLEVGTGFHRELSGRENIYLNGSILGLKRKEISQKLEEIIDFSGVEKFIDQPLKNYSSGMELRLAFSIAAHLEPEILLVDEVLAVGDFDFQRKCIGKMEEISRAAERTIVFVSHNMSIIKQLCTTGLVLQNGQVEYYGNINEAVFRYTSNFLNGVNRLTEATFDLRKHPNKTGNGEGLMKAELLVNGHKSEIMVPGADLQIDLDYFLQTKLTDPDIGIVIKDENYQSLIGLNNKHIGQKLELAAGKTGKASICIPGLNIFAPGKYLVDLYFGDQFRFYECLYDAFQFTVSPTDVYQTGIELKPEWNRIFISNIKISAE